MSNSDKGYLLTRRRSLALFGSGGAGLLFAGTNRPARDGDRRRLGTAIADGSDGHDRVRQHP